MRNDYVLARWMPTGVAFLAIPPALVFGLLFASLKFLFHLGWFRTVVDRIYYYAIVPIWDYTIED